MDRATKKAVKKLAIVGAALLVLFLVVPWLAAILLVCGLIDISRHGRWDLPLVARYFGGNGILTWVLSPVNLVLDLLSKKRPYRLQKDDFDAEAKAEIEEVLGLFDAKKEEIVADLRQRMAGKARGMLFYKWYGGNLDTSVPEFNREYRHIKTIGVSVFNSKESTSVHFGPIRLTVRVLYNLTPRQTDKIFIEVNGDKHYWHDDPLFIFDDTIEHRSVNDEDGERCVVFIDVLRPSPFTSLQQVLVKLMHAWLSGVNRIFYKNWEMLGKPKDADAAKA